MFLAPFFLLTLCLGRLTTILKWLRFSCSKWICTIRCSLSTNGSLFQSMLLLINPNTRLLLMITTAAGKNVCNFNIFAAPLHSVLHFSCGSLSVKFQTGFLPWIFSWPQCLSLLLPCHLQIPSRYQAINQVCCCLVPVLST